MKHGEKIYPKKKRGTSTFETIQLCIWKRLILYMPFAQNHLESYFFSSSSFSYEHTDARTYHRDSLSILHQQFFVDAAHLRTKKRKRKKINKFGILTKQSLKFTTGDARFIFIIMQIGQQTMAIRWKNDASLFISKYIF